MNNEEKILQLLEEQSKEQAKLASLLTRQGVMIELLNKAQNEQSMRLSEQSSALKSIQKDAAETRRVSQRTAVLMETEIHDNIQLLFDGHKTILETMAPKSRVEVLEDEVEFLKSVVKSISKEIAELKKAQ